jgi:putative transposase
VWASEFVAWYNEEHLHSGIEFVAPTQRHEGRDLTLLAGHSPYGLSTLEN